MKVTFIRTDKNNVAHVTTRTIEKMAERIKEDTKQGTVAELRRQLPMMISNEWTFKDMHLLPRIVPAMEMMKDASGELAFKAWNSLVLLTVGALTDREQIAQAKQLAMGMPSTLAAFTGSSGKTVKLLVRITSANGQEPQTEEEAEQLYQTAYPTAWKPISLHSQVVCVS